MEGQDVGKGRTKESPAARESETSAVRRTGQARRAKKGVDIEDKTDG